MTPRSIGFRLSAWYFVTLSVALGAFGLGTWLVMRRSLYEAMDDGLRSRVSRVQKFMDVHVEIPTLDEIRAEFIENSSYGPGAELLQVRDQSGNWVYRSLPLERHHVGLPLPSELNEHGQFRTIGFRHGGLRVFSARILSKGQPYSIQVAASLDELSEALTDYQVALLFLIPVVLAAASGGGYLLSRRALDPVNRIITDAQAIGSRSLDKRLAVPQTGDELQRLSETLNQMLERLDLAFRRITQFTADASHELRTPVAVIRTTAELALRRSRSSVEYESALREILSQSEKTTELIESLLVLARADTGKYDLQHAEVNLETIVVEACETGRKLALAKGIEFSCKAESRDLSVLGDARELRRLVLILLDNAVKYTPGHGSVAVSLSPRDGNAVLEVRDTGIGIPPDALPHIFERFYRADPARGSDTGGAGLGLAIAHWLVQQHGGEIAAESTPGSGSVFRVSIPLTK